MFMSAFTPPTAFDELYPEDRMLTASPLDYVIPLGMPAPFVSPVESPADQMEGEDTGDGTGMAGVSSDLVSGALSWTNPAGAVTALRTDFTQGSLGARTVGALLPPALLLLVLAGAGGSNGRFRR